MQKIILKEAKRCRDFFENRWRTLEGMPEYSDDNLSCMCANASLYLCYRLRKLGIAADFVVGQYDCFDHCWVEIDKKVLDITVTQFNWKLPSVYTPRSKRDFKASLRNLDGLRDLRKAWPFEQAVVVKQKNYLKYLNEQLALYEDALN